MDTGTGRRAARRRVGRGRGERAAARPCRRPAPLRTLERDRDLHDARRITAARHRHRARLAARRAPAVDGVPARPPRRHRRLRHPVRPRPAPDASVDVVGRRQVRGLRAPLRRPQRARLRRGRAQRRPLRPWTVRRAGAGEPGTRRALPRPDRRPRNTRREPGAVPAWRRASRRGRRGAALHDAAARHPRQRCVGTGSDRRPHRAWGRDRRHQARRRRPERPDRAPPRGGRQPHPDHRRAATARWPPPACATCSRSRTPVSRSATGSAR